MCPDPQMLSLYYDEELPSPWKEKLEAHLAECSPCMDRLEQFRRLSGILAGGPAFDERAASPAASAAGLARFTGRVWGRHSGWGRHSVWGRHSGLGRSVPVPLPVAVAAAALLLAFGVFFVRSPKPVAPAESVVTYSALETMVPASDLNGVLQYLGNDDSPDIVIIHLPESRSFMSSGKPAIIRAVDYSGLKSGGLKESGSR